MLSDEQSAIVKSIDGNNVVVAGPGTGKTHTLKFAVAHLFEIVPNAKPLLVTFTNSATDELSERIEAHIGEHLFNQCKITTFDSFLLELSKPIDNRRLVLGASQNAYIYRAYMFIVEQMGMIMAFEDVVGLVNQFGRGLEPTEETEFAYLVYQKYLTILSSVGKYGVRDLNMVAMTVLEATENGLLPELSYTHILVDEFQDTDHLMLKWLLHHGLRGKKVTTVGDDDQAIYSWRGARGYRNMREVVKVLNATTHIISKCRRCRPEIIEAAYDLVKFNQKRIEKNVTSSKSRGGVVKFLSFKEKEDEESFIFKFIEERRKEDIAILVRNNVHLDAIERHLLIHGIPFEKISDKSFWEKLEVTILLHFLRALTIKSAFESMATVISAVGEGEEVTNLVRLAAKRRGTHRLAMYGVEQDWPNKTVEIMQMAEQWNNDITDEGLILKLTKSFYEYTKMLFPPKKKGGRSKHAIACDTLMRIINKRKGSLKDRVKGLVKKLDEQKEKNNDGLDKSKIHLSSIHGSKGLEWHTVIMPSFNEGVLPSPEGNKDPELREEERRLALVGMTRAEEELYVCSSNKVSTFLQEAFPHIYKETAKFQREESLNISF